MSAPAFELVERLSEHLSANANPLSHASVGTLSYSLERCGLKLIDAEALEELVAALDAMLTASQPQHTFRHVYLGEAQEMARAVLAKARGESPSTHQDRT